MSNAVRGCLLIVAVGVFAPVVVEAQHGLGGFHSGCQTCFQPVQVCVCTTYRPVVETHLRKQNYLTYRDVHCTQYRQATCIENVPVTCLQNVTEMVMVPKLVTRQVPKTVMQQRVNHVTVPYQVTQRVPQMATQVVPYQTVRYVPETTYSVGPVGCAHPGQFGGQYGPQPGMQHGPQPGMPPTPQYQLPPAPAAPQPNHRFQMPVDPRVPPAPPADEPNGIDANNSGTIPLMPSITVPAYQSSPVPGGLAPHPDSLNLPRLDGWEFEAGRGSQIDRQRRLGEFHIPSSPPAGANSLPQITPGTFTPAPSAAAVWQTPRGDY